LNRHSKSFQFKYLADHERGEQVARPRKLNKQEYIMDSYDFIGLTERKDESLAVMKLLWNLEDKYLIVLSAERWGATTMDNSMEPAILNTKPNTVSAHDVKQQYSQN
jgi:hypothetical protein